MTTDKRGKTICPECGYHLLARNGEKLFCLRNGCEWYTEAKREEDKDLPEIHELKEKWQ